MGAAPIPEEDLMLVGGVSLREELVDDHESFEGNHPIVGLVEALGKGGHAGAHVGEGEARKVDDIDEVPLRCGPLVVACGLDNGYIEEGDGGAGSGAELGEAYARLVLDRANGSSECAWGHWTV